jgi:hypothetical protein
MTIYEAIDILEKMSSFNVTTVSYEAWQTLKNAVLTEQPNRRVEDKPLLLNRFQILKEK